MTLSRRRHLVRTRRTVTGLILVAAISFIAGMTDAVGLLLSGDFVSFMTGNTTRAALSFSQGEYAHAVILFFALWAFVIGNALGIILAHTLSGRRTFVVLASVALTIAVAAMLPEDGNARVRFYLVILAMGMINATIEHIEGLPIGLTYVTGALSRFGRGIGRWIVGDRNPKGWIIQTIPWTGMACGAVSGAFLTRYLGKDALWVVVLAIAAVAIATFLLPRPLHLHFQHRIVTGALRRR